MNALSAFAKKIISLILVALACNFAFAQEKNIPYVILVSFDGFRYDYVDKLNLPNFKSFINQGTQAEAIIPCFPSVTFPNHYSIVTGLYPGHHGLVNNNFYDAPRNTVYSITDRQKVEDSYYYGGTPLWQLAKQHHLKTASYFWVGSEVLDQNVQPDYFFRYDGSVPFQTRIDQVLAWLRLPEEERPHFITLYFSIPDHESHHFGPWSEEAKQAVFKIDSLLGNLMKGLAEINLPINTILVSDHGMSELTAQPETYIFLDDLMNTRDKNIIISHARALTHFYVNDALQADSLYRVLQQQEKNYTVYRKQDLPPRWHYQHDRVGDVVMVAKPFHSIQENDSTLLWSQVTRGSKFGVHGYDPAEVDDMLGIFYAQGPNIKQGLKIPAIRNIDVYPLVAKILHLDLPPIDGNPKSLKRIYKSQ